MAVVPAAFSTPQVPDNIKIEDEIYPLRGYPLAPLLDDEDFVANIEQYHRGGMCSINFRGYIADWSVVGDQLYLSRLVLDPCREKVDVPLSKVIQGARDLQHAHWFTGVLVVASGESLGSLHYYSETVYDRYTVLEITAGVITHRYDTAEPPAPSWEPSETASNKALERSR